MKSIYLLLLSVGFLCSAPVMAENWVGCDPKEIRSIRVKQNGDLMYEPKSNGYGERLAFKGSSEQSARNQMIANVLIMAIENGYLVQAMYDKKGYDCEKGDQETEAYWVEVQNPIH